MSRINNWFNELRGALYYPLEIAGLKRDLLICKINDSLAIAAFILLGDIDLTTAIAKKLAEISPSYDVILTPEAKSIPLAHEMARLFGNSRYIVARKSDKVYLASPLRVEVNSITSPYPQFLYLVQDDVEFLKGKRVLLIDDVISTGKTLSALEKLVSLAQAKVAGKMAVLAEGDAADRTDILFLKKLPVFSKEKYPEYFKS